MRVHGPPHLSCCPGSILYNLTVKRRWNRLCDIPSTKVPTVAVSSYFKNSAIISKILLQKTYQASDRCLSFSSNIYPSKLLFQNVQCQLSVVLTFAGQPAFII